MADLTEPGLNLVLLFEESNIAKSFGVMLALSWSLISNVFLQSSAIAINYNWELVFSHD